MVRSPEPSLWKWITVFDTAPPWSPRIQITPAIQLQGARQLGTWYSNEPRNEPAPARGRNPSSARFPSAEHPPPLLATRSLSEIRSRRPRIRPRTGLLTAKSEASARSSSEGGTAAAARCGEAELPPRRDWKMNRSARKGEGDAGGRGGELAAMGKTAAVPAPPIAAVQAAAATAAVAGRGEEEGCHCGSEGGPEAGRALQSTLTGAGRQRERERGERVPLQKSPYLGALTIYRDPLLLSLTALYFLSLLFPSHTLSLLFLSPTV